MSEKTVRDAMLSIVIKIIVVVADDLPVPLSIVEALVKLELHLDLALKKIDKR